MNDLELADLLKEMTVAVEYFDPDAVTKVGILWPQIIAALRRGPEPSTRMAVEDAIDKSKLPGTWEKLSRPPSGEMVMVPREPTMPMMLAGSTFIGTGTSHARAIYRAMLATAEAGGRKS